MKKVVIWGASGHAMVVADILQLQEKYELVGYLDNINLNNHGKLFYGKYILGGEEQIPHLLKNGIKHFIVGFGNCDARLALAERIQSMGFELVTAIHPSSVIAPDVFIKSGTVVAAGAVINPGCKIGENVIINTSSSIDHECVLGDGVHISPGAHLAGNVSIGRATWVGIGTSIIERVSIGNRTIIGAGSVVVEDIPDQVVAYGNPAKIKKTR